ncbi:MAG: methyltransferase domain-containing protein [Proteobacteria bacterium]|nr:methyltransferase domain-containing protein [Desulfobulbaceae bacterium]MBU4153152.1 methyltransferase domain-containing protein [Pseudomonadota bacterium]
MKPALLARLRCPQSGQPLMLEPLKTAVSLGAGTEDYINSGWLVSEDGQRRYPIRNGVPRFVPESNYADNFGLQWNHFSKTQLDSHSGHTISAERFWKATAWRSAEMKDRWVLDVGCGSGRFAEIALSSGAQVVALDYSSAVDACYANLRHHPNLHVVQGDIYALPFVPESFTFLYSLGVLQHTPDVAKAFAALPPMVAGGGRLCVDYYEKSFKSRLLPYYWLRPLTRRMDKPQMFALLKRLVPLLLPVSRALGRIPVAGKLLKRLVPVANYEGLLPLSEVQLREWALLDTFDWLSPTYDNPQNAATVRMWLEQAGLKEIEVLKAGHLVGRARK